MTKKQLEQLKDLIKTQGQTGNWDYDEYMCGLYNGLELARSVVEGDDAPKYRSKPAKGWRRSRVTDGYLGAPMEAESLGEAQDAL